MQNFGRHFQHPVKRSQNGARGFTLVELLVVIAIIGLLATLAVAATSKARSLAREAKAKEDLSTLATAIALLASDTGKWPNGCPMESASGTETYLDDAQSGINVRPSVGSQGAGCDWTTTDISRWAGPYANFTKDPWGNPYYFDPTYHRYQGCTGQTAEAVTPVVVSFGPNGAGPNEYDCDDIVKVLR